jgi:hypothetical protein
MIKKNMQLVLLIALAALSGVLGTLVVESHTAEAQHPSGFRVCFFLRGDPGWSHMHNPDHLARPVGRFPVPPDWTIVSGQLGGQQVANSVLICR